MMHKTRSRKMEPKGILSIDEEDALCAYIAEMTDYGLLFTPTRVKLKVGQMT